LDDPDRVRSQIVSIVRQIQRFDFDCNLVVTRKVLIWTWSALRTKPLYCPLVVWKHTSTSSTYTYTWPYLNSSPLFFFFFIILAEQNLRIMFLFSVSKIPGSGVIPPAGRAVRLRIVFSMSTRLSNNNNKYPPCVLLVPLARASVILQPYMTIVMTRILHAAWWTTDIPGKLP
jgi:hypothetical protein